MKNGIIVHSYSCLDDLANLLSKYCSIPSVKGNNALPYLDKYLRQELSANYIVVEKDYINQDYLDDFAFYYAYCFKPYPLKCTRIHFFKSEKGKEAFERKLNTAVAKGGDTFKKLFDANYLGHTVIKPIESTFVGHTLVLHPFSSIPKPINDFIPGVRIDAIKKYQIHFYGNRYFIESLAFQEQDANVAACATIAIWTLYQMAAEDYHVVLKPPSQITNESGVVKSTGDRVFPNDGLDNEEICRAITGNGLNTEVREFCQWDGDKPSVNHARINYWKALVYAYLPLKIPPLLGVYIPDDIDESAGESGYHLVAVTGYQLAKIPTHPVELNATRLVSDRINAIYVHDDQLAPFVTYGILPDGNIESPWNEDGRAHIFPIDIVLTAYPTVRISFDEIYKEVGQFMKYYFSKSLKVYQDKKAREGSLVRRLHIDDFEVSIRLMLSEQYKDSLHSTDINFGFSSVKEQQTKLYYLMKPRPKYIWRVDFLLHETLVFTFVYDATALKHADKLLEIFFTDKSFLDWFKIANSIAANTVLEATGENPIRAKNSFEFWVGRMDKMIAEFQSLVTETTKNRN